MNKLQWRYAFAQRYAERRGDFLLGWILSRTEAESYRMGQAVDWGLKNHKVVNFFFKDTLIASFRFDRPEFRKQFY